MLGGVVNKPDYRPSEGLLNHRNWVHVDAKLFHGHVDADPTRISLTLFSCIFNSK